MNTALQYIIGVLAIVAAYYYGYAKGLRAVIKSKSGISDKVLAAIRPSKIRLLIKKQPLPEQVERVKQFESKT